MLNLMGGAALGGGLSTAMNSTSNMLNALSGSRQGSYSKTDNSFAALYNYNAMQEAMAFNSAEADKNRKWQEKMSNTAYQRAVEDMRKAGINPILAYQQGGAETGSGSSASASPTSIGADAMSSSFGVAGIAEGVGQILGAMEGLGLNPQKAGKTVINWFDQTMGNLFGKDNSRSRSGGFGGSSRGGRFDNFGGNSTGGSFRG